VNPDTLVLGLTWFVVFLFSTTLHEAAHALAAYWLGDRTAYEGGQVTLNPLPHIQREPVGMILVPLISFAANGWMMGWASAPYDPTWAHRYPKRAALMAAAGPAANLLLVIVAGLLIRLGMLAGIFDAPDTVRFFSGLTAAAQPGWAEGAVVPLSVLFSLNLVLFAFNLLPLPPLDGSAILPAFMGDSLARRYQEILHQPMFSLIGLLAAWRIFPYLTDPLQIAALNLLYPGLGYH
jgi:Zn-dependent protease